MRIFHLGSAVAGVVVAGICTGTAWAGGPEGGAPGDLFEAVGSGTFDDTRDGPGGASTEVGFRATGATAGQASAAVVAACQAAGGVDCTSDEVTNDNLCIVSVFDPGTNVDAGGAGPTVEAARQDAIQRAAANNTPMSPAAAVLISACP
ncbi:MAG: hypothetical protein H6522_09485 [Mycolicibacterium sp.]|nr:hypothetical protein [Mycolicibacterium sp.]